MPTPIFSFSTGVEMWSKSSHLAERHNSERCRHKAHLAPLLPNCRATHLQTGHWLLTVEHGDDFPSHAAGAQQRLGHEVGPIEALVAFAREAEALELVNLCDG